MRRLAEVQDQGREIQHRLATVESELAKSGSEQISDAGVKAALKDVASVWGVLQG